MNGILLIQLLFFDFIGVSVCLVLALVPFLDKIYVGWRLGILSVIFYCFVILSRLLPWFGFISTDLISVIRIVVYLSLYWMLIKSELPKVLFVMFVLLNYMSFSIILLNYLSALWFPHVYDTNPYSFQSAFLLLGLLAVSAPLIYYMMNQKVRPLVQASENKKLWNYIWLVPAVFCIIFHYNVLGNGGVSVFSRDGRNVAYSFIVNAGSLFVTYLVIKLVEESSANLFLKNENYQLTLQTLQYENLKNHMEEARRARHDLRHNMTLIQSYLTNHNYEAMEEYIRQYFKTLPSNTPISYCDCYALNALIVYYEDIAGKKGIAFTVKAACPQIQVIPDTDFVVLLGNLLENAVEACCRQSEGSRFIKLWISNTGNAIIIAVDNSYDGEIHKEGDSFLSSKGNRMGLGLSSVDKIAEKYHGIAKYEYDGHVFSASVMLSPSTDFF